MPVGTIVPCPLDVAGRVAYEHVDPIRTPRDRSRSADQYTSPRSPATPAVVNRGDLLELAVATSCKDIHPAGPPADRTRITRDRAPERLRVPDRAIEPTVPK